MNKEIEYCTKCECPVNKHSSLNDCAPLEQRLAFYQEQMLISIEKHWRSEARFNEITKEYSAAAFVGRSISQTDRNYQAANDPRRKAAAANAKYHIDRATMYASVINALK